MAYLMHIAVSKDVRFDQNTFYFEYEGVQFKYIQNDFRRHSDVLVTILPTGDDLDEQDRVFAIGSKYVSALAWQTRMRMAAQPGGGMGMGGSTTLRSVRCRCFGPPQFFTMGNTFGFGFEVIAAIETPVQERALALFMEAHSANKPMLSVLFYWQVLEVLPRAKPKDAGAWVNDAYKAKRVHVSAEDLKRLDPRGRSLGEYLYEDCRHAIAHLKRFPGLREVRFHDFQDLLRMKASARVAGDFAREYIESELGLTRHKRMTLVRKGSRGFPVYRKDGTFSWAEYKPVRPRKPRRGRARR